MEAEQPTILPADPTLAEPEAPLNPEIAAIAIPEAATPAPPDGLRLDLGSGQCTKEGFIGLDIGGKADRIVNLFRFPWTDNQGVTIESNSVDELYSSHFVEHIPQIMTDPTGRMVDPTECGPDHKNLFFRFFEEALRVMKPGAIFTVIVPSARHHRGFQDPTHTRFFVIETFYYLNAANRKAMGIEHYETNVDFEIVSLDWSSDIALNTRHPEVRAQKLHESWNTIHDWLAVLRKPAKAPDAVAVP